jgi:peroxiredoxin
MMFLTLLMAASLAAEPKTTRAELQPAAARKAAPAFALQDPSGKTVTLDEYRGKVVVLDFWATWCGGCKEEIPWFAEFERKYSAKGLAVVGVSLDEEGWKIVRPFLAKTDVPYRIVLGNDPMSMNYAIGNMPETFLIDREGRIAAKYVGVVDRADVEANIQKMLAPR